LDNGGSLPLAKGPGKPSRSAGARRFTERAKKKRPDAADSR